MARIEPDGSGQLITVDGARQSWVDLARPQGLGFEYMQRIADVIDVTMPAGQPVTAVHVGGAGLAIPRMIAAARPRSRQVVIEPDELLTEFVREELPLPHGHHIRVRAQAAPQAYADLRADTYDLAIVDAYADGEVVADVVSAEAFVALAPAIRAGGLVVVNLVPSSGVTRATVQAGMRAAFGPIGAVLAESRVLSGARHGNLVMVSGQVPIGVLVGRGRRAVPAYRVVRLGSA